MDKKLKIVIDVDRMRYPNTGMYHFCESLYKQFVKNTELNIWFYKYKKTILLETDSIINISIFNKLYLKPNKSIILWHTISQLSNKIPRGNILFVYTIHDLNILYTNKSKWKINRTLRKIKRNIEKADYVTFISNFTMREVGNYFDLSKKKMKVIHNGVHLELYPNFDHPRIKPSKPFLFSLGVIAPKKNLHTLIELILENDYDLVLSGIIMDINYYNSILIKIAELDLRERVHFTFAITEEEKYWYYRNCTAFIFPSISEGFGLPPIEAMQLGKPVFLSTLTSLPEIGGDVAYYFKNFEPASMQKTLFEGLKDYNNNPNKKLEILEWSKQFNWEKASAEYISIYKELLAEKHTI